MSFRLTSSRTISRADAGATRHRPSTDRDRRSRRSARIAIVLAIVMLAPAGLPAASARAEEPTPPELPVTFPEPMPRPASALIDLSPTASPSSSPSSSPSPTPEETESPAPPAEPQEIVSLRTRDSKTFRNPDGSQESMFGQHLHYVDDDGEWADVDLSFRQDGSGWVMDRNDLEVRVSALGVSATERVTGKGILWPTTVVPTVAGRRATFEGPLGLTWSYVTRKSGIKLLAPVSEPLGAQTITFPYQLLGGATPLTLVDGALRSDVFTVPPPVAIGADDQTYPLGEWQLGAGPLITWTFDDTSLPVSAFPYQLDPTTTFDIVSSSNDGTVRRHGTSYVPPCDYAYPDEIRIAATRAFDPAYDTYDVHNALMRWDTSSIPNDSTILSATVRVRVTRADNANGKKVTADWYSSGWPPITCADSASSAQTTAASSMSMPGGNGDHDFVLANVSGVSATGTTGLRFHLSNGTPTGINRLHWASFDATDYHEPYLLVKHNRAPYAPDTLTPSSGTFTTTPQLSARFLDPDSAFTPPDRGTVFFEIKSGTTVVSSGYNNAPSGTVGIGETARFNPPGGLPNGSYTWRAFGKDAVTTGPWSATGSFTVAAPAQVVKAVSPVQEFYSKGQAVTFTVTTTNTQASSMAINSVTDTFPSGLSVINSTFQTFTSGAPTPTLCTPTTTPSCTLSASTFTAGGFTLAAGASRSFTVRAIVDGVNRGCASLENVASATSGAATSTGSASLIACDAGLGLESWWSYVSRTVSPTATASVNVANGNVVVQDLDSTPIQAHGHLAYALRRTYNSQDTTAATLPGSIGAGWMLSVADAGDAAGLVGATALKVPSLTSFVQPLGPTVTLVDRDGTSHEFTANTPLSTPVNVTDISSSGVLAALLPKALSAAGGVLCVDQTYKAPPGVHLSLWRYLRLNAGSSCSNLAAGNPVEIGFAAMRPDRVRYEFSATGKLLSVVDASGVEMRYQYEQLPAPTPAFDVGKLQYVYEPRSCADAAVSTCRRFKFEYPSSSQVKVTDSVGRQIFYDLDTSSTPALLSSVTTKSEGGGVLSTIQYTYGSAHCPGAGAAQLCSATDPAGALTEFAYEAADLGPARVSTMTDRGGTVTSFAYSSATQVDATVAGQLTQFKSIDSFGRVGEVDAGSAQTPSTPLRKTTYAWDDTTTDCRQPGDGIDHNLCSITRDSGTGVTTPDETTSYLYNPEGRVLRARRENGAADLDTTFGYVAQYAQSNGTHVTATDAVSGSGSWSQNEARPSSPVYYVVDRTQALTPRGNGAGAGYATYLTTYKVDNNTSKAPTTVPSGTLCTNPDAPAANTGLMCQETAPKFNDSVATITRHRYNTFGEKTQTTEPKAIAEGASSSYTYTYYADTDRDLSNSVSAGGWLKAVTDPGGRFVAFAYDRAGNRVRAWDRNATWAQNISAFPGTADTPYDPDYTETLYGQGSTRFSQPWRHVLARSDQLRNLTTYSVDANGNVLSARPPRGNAASSSAYDTTFDYDARDRLVTTHTPASPAGANTFYGYDAVGNLTSATDPLGAVVTYAYDDVHRKTGRSWTRGPWAGDGSDPTACRQSTENDAPTPAGRTLCSETTAYDGVDNVIAASDGNAQTTTYAYDAVHREIKRLLPRNDGTLTTLRTDTVYDLDGNITDVCPPRQFTEGGSSSCTRPAYYSEQREYDAMGRLSSRKTFRGTTASTTTYGYDGNGNLISRTDPNFHQVWIIYDLSNRKTSESVPRDDANEFTTTWTYDPAGNIKSVNRPAGIDRGTGADGAMVINEAWTASNPYVMPEGKNFTDLTLENGGWITIPPYDPETGSGGVMSIKATGTVYICPTCGIHLQSRGMPGGAGGDALDPENLGNGSAGTGPGGGGGGSSGTAYGGGGGGGGHSTAGANGGTAPTLGGAGGTGGSAYGASDLSDADDTLMVIGSGGGGGGTVLSACGGNGGAGAGFLRLTADTILIAGRVRADGRTGYGGCVQRDPLGNPVIAGGGGGGGSGGSVWFSAHSSSFVTGAVNAGGGPGGDGHGAGDGGDGAPGRVRFDGDYVGQDGAITGTFVLRGLPTRTTAYKYDAANRLVETIVGADHPEADSAGLVDAQGSKNNRYRRAFDADGNVVAEFDPRAFATSKTTPNARYMTRIDYDADNRPIARYTPRYDDTTTDPGLGSTQTNQCPTSGVTPETISGVPAYPTSVGLCVTKVEYNANGDTAKVILPTAAGSTSSAKHVAYTYTDDRRQLTVTPPSPVDGSHAGSSRTTFLYDAVGREVRRSDPESRQSTTEYYSDGLVKRRTGQPNGALTHEYTFEYDANGNTTKSTDAVGDVRRSTYYSDNLVKDVFDGADNKTSYGYDLNGNPTSVKSPSANALEPSNSSGTATINTFTHDNLLASTIVPVSADGTTKRRRTSFGYDGGGRKVSQVVQEINSWGTATAIGRSQEFRYFLNDRVATERTIGDEAETLTKTYSYDPAGNAIRIAEGPDSNLEASVITAGYYTDNLLRTASATGGSSNTYSYNGSGILAARSDQVCTSCSPVTTTYAYNDAGLPTSMSGLLSGNSTWSYDHAGRWDERQTAAGETLTYTFNPDDTLASVAQSTPGGSATFDYTYDGNYRITTQDYTGPDIGSETPDESLYTYTYDDAGRVDSFAKGSTSRAITWDPNGNRRKFGSPTDADYSELTYRADDTIASETAGSITRTYTTDSAGRVERDSCREYDYDGFDRMSNVVDLELSGCPDTPATSYEYDALDRNVKKTGESTAVFDGLTARLLYSSSQSHYSLDPFGNPVGLKNGATQQSIADDGHGNIALISAVTGDLTCSARFDPFGAPATPGGDACDAGTSPHNELFYRGARRDSATGTYQLGWRTYDPAKGSFLSADTYRAGSSTNDLSVGTDPLTRNTYAYVNGDPVNLYDPDGHFPIPHPVGPGMSQQTPEARARREQYRFQQAVGACARQAYMAGPTKGLDANCQALFRGLQPPSESPGGVLKRFAHRALDTIGLVPVFGEVADAINCGWYGLEGNALEAGLSCAAIIPIVGIGATAAKWTKNTLRAIDEADNLHDLARVVNSAEDVVSTGKQVRKAPGSLGKPETTTLYRAVGPKGLAAIDKAKTFQPSPSGTEFLGFYPTPEQASNLARMYRRTGSPDFRGPHTMVSAEVPTSMLDSFPTANISREGPAFLVPNELLPQLGTPTVWDYMVVP